MSEIIPHDYVEPGKRRRLRVPGWAVGIAIACAATCVAVFAVVKVDSNARSYHMDVYNNCVQTGQNRTKFIDSVTRLRDADQAVLDQAQHGNEPVTAFGEVDLIGIQQRVDAYNELLDSSFISGVPCSSLKP